MLTKALLKYTVRKKQVYPKFVDTKKESLKTQATELITLYERSEGETVGQLEEQTTPLVREKGGPFEGLNKLLLERISSSLEETDEDVTEKRWNIILEAQELRKEKLIPSLDSFYELLEMRLSKKIPELQEELYCDLPEYQRVKSFQKISGENLLHRYNTALVQGLLLQANRLKVTLPNNGKNFKQEEKISQRRFLFRQLKFHRLLCEVKEDTKERFTFELSGPLSIFQQRQTYGLRFANFFPHILSCRAWQMEAELTLKTNSVLLKLDDSSGLKNHYTKEGSYLPKELLLFIESFNKKKSPWQASASSSFLNLGEKSYCFPDIELQQKEGSTVHIELFHRWHQTQLLQRLQSLEKHPETALILGVCKHIMNKKDLEEALQKTSQKNKIFYFNDFPSSGKLLSFLKEWGAKQTPP